MDSLSSLLISFLFLFLPLTPLPGCSHKYLPLPFVPSLRSHCQTHPVLSLLSTFNSLPELDSKGEKALDHLLSGFVPPFPYFPVIQSTGLFNSQFTSSYPYAIYYCCHLPALRFDRVIAPAIP